MTWHLEPTQLHGRRYVRGGSYEQRSQFATIVTVRLEGRVAHLSGMLNDGTQGAISRADYLELRDKLRAEYGVEVIESERHGEERKHDTGPVPLD
jgi:hypothetical protein